MQATLNLLPSILPLQTPTKTLASPWKSIPRMHTPLCPPIKAAPVNNDNPSVDYSSTTSVFPAEACETVGGEACDVDMYPEVKLKPDANSTAQPKTASDLVDREYVEYNNPKTVFPDEACDDLGGEFCEPEYQKGVY